jgi:Mrp family chromosome partitioning ATPase
LAALAGALFLGLLFSGLKEVLHARFRLPGDITARMAVLELGTIPDCRPGKDARQRQTLIDTAFRSLLQSLWSTGRPGRRPRVVVVASPQPGDGRSMVAANLALAFADTSRWVLLIDGNARTPSLHGAFSVRNDWGLADLLREDTAIDLYDFRRLFQRSAVAGLWVLPAGTGPLDLSSRQAQDRLSDLVARARMEFHNVIVDTPPGPLPEVPILANSADGVLLVVRASKTTQRSAIALADQFFGHGIGVVGAVLNDWRPGVA